MREEAVAPTKQPTTLAGSGSDEGEFYDCVSIGDAENGEYTDDDGEDVEDEPKLCSRSYERMLKRPVLGCCVARWPRTCALVFGVALPLFFLVIFCLALGAAICVYEAPPEIDSNNAKLANLHIANKSALAITNLTKALPKLCFFLYLESTNNNNTDIGNITLPTPTSVNDLIDELREDPDDPFDDRFDEIVGFENYEPPIIVINVTEFEEFMSACGKATDDLANDLVFLVVQNLLQVTDQLSFNWIRCYEGATPNTLNFNGGGLNETQRSFEGQAKQFAKVWEEDRARLFTEYYNQFLQDGIEPPKAFAMANRDATNDASGGSTCDWNAPAAAWFWFTVQTTVGYGNAAPTTTESRAMVYTVGFFSILAFGGVLATAGYILSYLFDDFVSKVGLKILAKPLIGATIWGTAYYLWMFGISGATKAWKQVRLDEPFSLKDGYWFAYISTTTVGLGDIVLEPEGIIGADVFAFPVLFLVGFTYFSAFIGKVIEWVNSLFQSDRRSLLDTLLEKKVTWKETFKKKRPAATATASK